MISLNHYYADEIEKKTGIRVTSVEQIIQYLTHYDPTFIPEEIPEPAVSCCEGLWGEEWKEHREKYHSK